MIFFRSAVISLAAVSLCAGAQQAMDAYSQQVFFDNSTSRDIYYYSHGKSVAPSTLEVVNNHIPLETHTFISGPNSLKLHWHSDAKGAWSMELQPAGWSNRKEGFPGRNLAFWVYSSESLAGAQLPRIAVEDRQGGFAYPIALSDVLPSLAANKWTRVVIPVSKFRSESVQPFDATQLAKIVFSQNGADDTDHVMLVDDIRVETPTAADMRVPAAPIHLAAKAYERHVDLTWDAAANPAVSQYVIYRSTKGGPFKAVGVQRPSVGRYMDFTGEPDADLSYRITARTAALRESAASNTVQAHTHTMSDDELLNMVEEASFHYYWDGAEQNSGMAHESVPGGGDIVAVGASGFGIMNLIVAAERGFVPREEIVDRMLKITAFLARADRFHGVWPHYLSGSTGHILPVFGIYDDGGDLVETSFLMQGLLAARGYFTHDAAKEKLLRDRITELWKGVEWDWYMTPEKDALWWHWSPRYSYFISNRLQGYNESMITYVLAIASPTHGIPASLYDTGWAAQGNPQHRFPIPNTYYGIHVDVNYTPQSPGPMFFTHYNFFGFDPHFRDRYTDWYQNGRNISLVQQKYAVENPLHFKGYGASAWGLSAVTGPHGYREFKPFQEDDGTIAPTAALGAYAYTPQESFAALKHFYRDMGAQAWSIYGFVNAFNEQLDWYAPDELGLNQAPQAIMIENGRTGLLWRSFMANPEIQKMEDAVGLKPYGKDKLKDVK